MFKLRIKNNREQPLPFKNEINNHNDYFYKVSTIAFTNHKKIVENQTSRKRAITS